MTEAKHTPGPWLVVQCKYGSHHVHIDTAEGARIGTVILRPDGQTNAKLIAAAPDLLVACKAAMRIVEAQSEAEHLMDGFGGRKPRPSDGLLDQLSVAIARAE